MPGDGGNDRLAAKRPRSITATFHPALRQPVGKRMAGLACPDDGRVVMLGHACLRQVIVPLREKLPETAIDFGHRIESHLRDG